MTDQFSRAFKASVVIHVVVIALLLVIPFVMRLVNKDKKKEEIVFIELVNPALPSPVTEPKPAVKPEPKPKPEPPKPEVKEPEPPKPKPEPPKLKKPQQIKVNTNRIVRQEQPKPKPKPLPFDAYALKKELMESLPDNAPDQTSEPSGQASDLTLYYSRIYGILDAAWVEPPSIGGLHAVVAIRIGRNGAIMQRTLQTKSGSAAMDDSVMNAVRSIATFPKLPDSVSRAYIDVTIKFESTGLSM